uniref:Reverse transcriptase domain-containing protein n=1 Tax=Parastrongyloides trichosuri TaxID=131310 RepID=A0A0N4ZDX3_PARTI
MIVLINLGDRFDEVKYSLERVMITNNTATQTKGAILETLGEEVLNKTNRRKSPKHSGDKDQAANVTNDSKTIKLTNKKDD